MLAILRRQFISIGLTLALISLLAVPIVGGAASLTVTPGETAGIYTWRITGFPATEKIYIVLVGPSQQSVSLGTHMTDGTGSHSNSFKMARHSEPGTWAINIHDEDSTNVASTTFVLPLLGPNVSLAADPQRAPLGTTFTFSSDGYEANEVVGYWLTGPDGKAYLTGSEDATDTGRIVVTALIGSGMPVGQWRMSAYGQASDRLGIASVTVDAPGGGGPIPGTPPAPVTSPNATLTVMAGATPGTFEVRGTQFGHNETVHFSVIGPSGQAVGAGPRTSDGEGVVQWSLRMPRHSQPGRWTIKAHDEQSTHSAMATFDMPLLGPNITLAVNPTRGPVSTAFTVTGGGFDPNESVQYWLTAPDGQGYTGGIIDASTQGNVTITYTAASDRPQGTWTLTAYAPASDRLGIVPFTVG